MQQTEKYQLNLIETSDTFSPAPLNENMEKVEGALEGEAAARAAADAAEAQARAEADAALDQRLQVFEARHVVIGRYTPAHDAFDINLGFDPKAVLILATSKHFYSGMLIPGAPVRNDAVLIPNGFRISAYGANANGAMLNHQDMAFAYLALG